MATRDKSTRSRPIPRSKTSSSSANVSDSASEDATARLSQDPAQSSKYVFILPKHPPKPAQDNLSSKSARSVVDLPTRCRVQLCPRRPCTLRSHQQYAFPLPPPLPSNVKPMIYDEESEDTKRWKSESPRLKILQGGVDGLPVLPLDGTDKPLFDKPLFRELFHRFFSYQFDRIYRLLLPPPMTKTQRLAIEGSRQVALTRALSGPVFCLHYMAATYVSTTYSARLQTLDRNTMLLQGRMMALLRQKLDSFEMDEVQELVLVILTLVMFQIAIDRPESLHLHRKAVHHLIVASGGVHNMGNIIPMILTLDRILSMFTCLTPLYIPPSNQFIRKPRILPVTYGHYLNEASSLTLLGPEIHQYCIDACHLIDILEYEGWGFEPSDPPIHDSPNLHYFFFFRDCLANNFVHLNVSTAESGGLPRCVLLAAKIVDYTTLMDNYLVAIPKEMGNRLRDLIRDENSNIAWEDNQSILLWLLFVLTCMPNTWPDRPWALIYLKHQLCVKYSGSDWPSTWRSQEHDNVCRFVWSDSKFQHGFVQTCNELQGHTSPTP